MEFTQSVSGVCSFIQPDSDLQFMLHHVKGVVREVDLLNAVDDLLLCQGVTGMLPQLPQLLLKESESDRWTEERSF